VGLKIGYVVRLSIKGSIVAYGRILSHSYDLQARKGTSSINRNCRALSRSEKFAGVPENCVSLILSVDYFRGALAAPKPFDTNRPTLSGTYGAGGRGIERFLRNLPFLWRLLFPK
jgi:hypothetical protein